MMNKTIINGATEVASTVGYFALLFAGGILLNELAKVVFDDVTPSRSAPVAFQPEPAPIKAAAKDPPPWEDKKSDDMTPDKIMQICESSIGGVVELQTVAGHSHIVNVIGTTDEYVTAMLIDTGDIRTFNYISLSSAEICPNPDPHEG